MILSAFYLNGFTLLRFLLQLARADFYNPISPVRGQGHQPLVIPLRKVIPGLEGLIWPRWAGADSADDRVYSSCSPQALRQLTPARYSPGPYHSLGAGQQIYFWSILAVIVLSWVSQGSYHPP